MRGLGRMYRTQFGGIAFRFLLPSRSLALLPLAAVACSERTLPSIGWRMMPLRGWGKAWGMLPTAAERHRARCEPVAVSGIMVVADGYPTTPISTASLKALKSFD